MGPDRTNHSRKNARAGPSTVSAGPKALPMDQRDGSGVPGVSKLKASLRQTKRLLAKENLEPGLRITTERRLVSLEADLANALKRDVEKKNGAKYHQVKFFERQKLQRIIKRVKRSITEGEEDVNAQKKLEKELKEARIMLNYVRHYPNTEKYIALFPSTTEGEEEEAEAEIDAPALKLPKLFKKPKGEVDESTTKRREILDRISGMMEKGDLPAEPENAVNEKKSVTLNAGAGGKADVKGKRVVEEEEDDFFGVDEE